MEAAIFCLAYAGFTLLCIVWEGPHRPLLARHPGPARRRALGAAGWALLAASFAAAVARQGWSLGPVEWVGVLALSGMALVLLVAYAPRAALWSGLAAILAAPVLWLAG